VLPDAGVLTWGEVTQYRFMTLSSEQMLTDLLTASRTVVAKLSRFCENAFTNFADQDQAALSISDLTRLLFCGVMHSKPHLHRIDLRAFQCPTSFITTRE
jgi:hypothetical protein